MPETTLDHRSAVASDDTSSELLPELLLILAHCTAAPDRTGEALLLPERAGTELTFGRGDSSSSSNSSTASRARLVRRRPGRPEPTGPLDDPFLSRDQLALSLEGDDGIRVRNLGKRKLLVRGHEVSNAVVHEGETFEIKGQLVFLCVRRPRALPSLRHATTALSTPFGGVDAHGIVGESGAAWALREEVAFVGPRVGHALILGESGTGKELVARALHQLSPRHGKPLVARNAATFPSGLIDAELFGNVGNYPNPGMPERPGIIGEANGSTLFLDEIGELPIEMQARLLRVLDKGGEYHRLGESKKRVVDLRLVGATNRALSELKHDLVARVRYRIAMPSLNDRREDVPLLLRHVLRLAAKEDHDVRAQFFPGDPATSWPRISASLVAALCSHRYVANVRELDTLLWSAIASSRGDSVELTDSVRAALDLPEQSKSIREVTREEIEACMKRNGGVQEKVWRELGFASRHVLTRLLRKHAISTREG